MTKDDFVNATIEEEMEHIQTYWQDYGFLAKPTKDEIRDFLQEEAYDNFEEGDE